MKADGADRYVRGLNRAVEMCEAMVTAQPTVIMGDFNSNTTWDHEHPKDQNHSALVRRLDGMGLVSAYHSHHAEEHGRESLPTFFFYRSQDRPYHSDFCFVPKAWQRGIKDVSVGEFTEWREFSDHMPLMCDVEPR